MQSTDTKVNITQSSIPLAEQELDVTLGKFPKSIYFIVPNEFCERFCFYGIKNLLNKYLQTAYRFPEYKAKAHASLFNALVYLFPLVGAAVSDSFLGKYWTIVYLSIIYLVGNILISIFSIDGFVGQFGSFPEWSYLLPTLLIALGTGGIKPCVSAHGGDQFLPSQTKLMDQFFSLFYVAINLGSLIAQYLTPYIKDYVNCFGKPCYLLAFGIPTIAFAFALILFIIGYKYYRIIPPTFKFMPWVALKITWIALIRYTKASPLERQSKTHFLEFSNDIEGEEMVEETRLFGKVFLMFLPTSFFWMLYDQGSTEWQNNYDLMEQKFLWFIPMPTEASSNLNSIMVILMVPALSYWVYPWLKSKNIHLSLIQRMIWGWFFLLLAFLLSTSLQYYIVANSTNLIMVDSIQKSCEGCINGTIQFPQYFLLSLAEAMLSPTCLNFAYTQVGPKMKSSSTSIYLLTSAIGDYFIVGLELGLTTLDSITKMWIYLIISTIFFVLFIFMERYWYVSKEDEEALSLVKLDCNEVIKV